MDIKVTKKRLSGLLFYDWLILVAIIVAIILVWELLFSITSVKLTPGQNFYYYYDVGVTSNDDYKLKTMIFDDNALSFNVITVTRQNITASNDILPTKLQVKDGDVIFSSNAPKEGKANRVKYIANSDYNYGLQTLVNDARKYIKRFTDEDGNIDDQKVRSIFLSRMKGDNRFRTDTQKKAGIEEERARIEKLIIDTNDLQKLIDYDVANPELNLLFRFTRYSDKLEAATGTAYEQQYANLVQAEKDAGRENYAYGINLGKLTGGEVDVTEYVTLDGTSSAENVIMMALNFLHYQPHEQFEVIGFMMAIVRNCSNILNPL